MDITGIFVVGINVLASAYNAVAYIRGRDMTNLVCAVVSALFAIYFASQWS